MYTSPYGLFSRGFYAGWTTLFLAAHKNNLEIVKLLCGSQANVDKRSEDGKTAIAIAVQTGEKLTTLLNDRPTNQPNKLVPDQRLNELNGSNN